MGKKKETYEVDIRCTNCNYGKPEITVVGVYGAEPARIPMGVKVESYLATRRCPLCGCSTLKRLNTILK
jgi:hypothetical protein